MRPCRTAPILSALFACAAITLAARGARADESPAGAAPAHTSWSRAFEVDVNSHYVWRGIAYSRGMVVNPSLTVGRGDFSLNAWANVDHDPAAPRALNEVDWTLGWSNTLAGVALKPSALLYTYPTTPAPSTCELALEADVPVAPGLSTFTQQSVDVRAFRGAAWTAGGLRVELPTRHGITLSGSASFGRGWWRFASAYASPALEGLNVVNAGVAADVALPGGFSMRPHLDAYRVGNRAVRTTLTGDTPLVFGVAIDGAF